MKHAATPVRVLCAAILASAAIAAAPPARADEIDDAVKMFTADDGLTAAEKIPALKAFIEAHMGNPKIETLVSILGNLAEEAGDAEADKWAGEVFHKLRDAADATDATKRVPPEADAEYYEAVDAAFAKLAKLPDVAKGASASFSAPVSADFMNKATRQGAIANLREAVRCAIGCMTPDAEKKLDAQFAAALEYPSEAITDWCAKASPIVNELARVRAAMLSEVAAYDETFAESALARDAGNAEASHALLRQLACITSSLKAGQSRMNALLAQFEALGPMADPAAQKAQDAADYKAAKKALLEYFGPELKIGGWYEAVGKSLCGSFKTDEWTVSAPTNTAAFWRRDRIYIRPLVKLAPSGCVVCYVNMQDSRQANIMKGVMSDDGSMVLYGRSECCAITPFLDDGGKECVAARMLDARGEFSSAVYRRAGGESLEMLPGKTKKELVSFDEIRDENSTAEKTKFHSDNLAWLMKGFDEKLAKLPVKDVMEVPLAKDVYYVLEDVRPWEPGEYSYPMAVTRKGVPRRCAEKGKDDYLERMAANENAKGNPHGGVDWDGPSPWPPQLTCDHLLDTGKFKCLLDRRDEVWYTSFKRKTKVVLDTGTAYVDIRWEAPSPLIPVESGDVSMRYWHRIDMNPLKYRTMEQEADVSFMACRKNHKAGDSGTEEITGTIFNAKGEARCKPGKSLSLCVTGIAGGAVGVKFVYARKVMTAEEAAAAANMAAVKFKEMAKGEWHETKLEEQAAAIEAAKVAEREIEEKKASVMAKAEALTASEKEAAEKAKKEAIEFHEENVRFIEGTISRLQDELAKAKDAGARKALEWQIACEKSNVVYEQDRIRAEKSGEWHASRTPFDDMCLTQVRESAAQEVEELARADRARKFVEKFMETEDWKGRQMIQNRMDEIAATEPMSAQKWENFKRQLIFNRREELSRAGAGHEAEIAAWDDSITYLENVKTVSEVAVSIGCGGGGFGVAKGIGCAYMMTTGWIDGGFTNALNKTARFASDIADVALETYDGLMQEGWKGAMKKAEIAVAVHYGIPFLMDRLKGAPSMSLGEYSPEKLRAWNPSKQLATRKPRVADVNAAFFESKNAKQQIKTFVEKKAAFDRLNKAARGQGGEELLKARREMFGAAGKVNENPVAKGLLKYDKAYLKDGTSKLFADQMTELGEIARVRTINDMTLNKGFSRQELVSFRNKASLGSVGMDMDLGLVETKDMKILRNGKTVSKYEYARNAQESMNEAWKEITGCDAEKSFINITHSGDKEAYRNLAVLDASGDAQKMREIMRGASASDIGQMMDVSRVKSLEMEMSKKHPKMVGLYESARGWAKDLDTKYLPALEGEIEVLKEARKNLGRAGKDLAKKDLVKLRKLELAHKKYKQISDVCGKVGRMDIPLYDADGAIRTATGGKGVVETIDDLETTFKALNLQYAEKAKNIKKGLGT